jgi:5-methylcytosine-specific restriction endonuclease McrA
MPKASVYWTTAKAFYNSPLWRKLATECKMRDAYTCRRCGHVAVSRFEKSRLDAHHVVSRPNVEYATALDVLANLITLCDECHQGEHAHMRRSPTVHTSLYRATRLPRRRY